MSVAPKMEVPQQVRYFFNDDPTKGRTVVADAGTWRVEMSVDSIETTSTVPRRMGGMVFQQLDAMLTTGRVPGGGAQLSSFPTVCASARVTSFHQQSAPQPPLPG
eukprot:TRINITY_DN66180_c2_g2_i4.p1 TRINITY_DN66180_c2_g2~~TRINITY_DN66180_c2_g2_i4.p1  ORF type:complete len:105 (+),score=12.02 TRINITY_DN66180_c2_g2_i4:71-385(+)